MRALLDENREHLYHAAYSDPHTAAELDLRQIRNLVDDLLDAHGDWIPQWARPEPAPNPPPKRADDTKRPPKTGAAHDHANFP